MNDRETLDTSGLTGPSVTPIDWSKCVSSRLMVLGETPPPSLSFHGPSKEVMRISQDGVWVDPDLSADEAAKAVIDALDLQIKELVRTARNAALEEAAKKCEARFSDGAVYIADSIRRLKK